MQRQTFDLYNAQQAHTLMQSTVWPAIKAHLLAGTRLTIEVKKSTRSIEQNSRLWAMLSDVSKQVDWYGRKLSPEEWKHVFTAALKKQDVVPGIDSGFVVMALSTSKMTKGEMTELQDLIEAFGAQQGVRFAAP